MAIAYRIYSNGGTGGPVDFSAPVATTADLGFVTQALAPSTDSTFAVRAYDTDTGLEEANTAAQARVVLDGQGQDVTRRPNAPHAVCLAPSAGGGFRVSWAFRPDPRCGVPDGFKVSLARGATATGAAAVATIGYVPGQAGYSCVLPGPIALATYTAVVESYNAVGTDGGTATATAAVGLPAAPLLMEAVAARVIGVSNSGSAGGPP
jgi:hypothetical protein